MLGVAKKEKKTASRGRASKAPAKAKKKAGRRAASGKPAKKALRSKAVKPKKKVAEPKAPPPKPKTRPRPKKTRLRKAELREFRRMLLEKRRTLVGDLSGMEQETFSTNSGGNLSSMPTHMADVGTDNFEHEFTLGLLESEQAMLSEINEALQRIEDRTYGVCPGTGKAIPKARLRAKPWAKYTVEYARLLEKGLVREPDPDSDIVSGQDDDETSED